MRLRLGPLAANEGAMKGIISYITKEAFQRLVDQWPECEYLGAFDTTIQLFDKEKKHLGSVALKPDTGVE